MAFYRNHVYPHLVSLLGNPKPIQEVRQRVVPLAQGAVLEIGVGPGVNFAHYDPAKVSRLYALEPNSGMVKLAEQRRGQTKIDIEFAHGAEAVAQVPGGRAGTENAGEELIHAVAEDVTL